MNLLRLSTHLLLLPVSLSVLFAAEPPPNVVYIMSDELAYFEVGYNGQTRIKTPNIDRFAREGITFNRTYAASPVCGPLRCNLMTGKHAGHASVRSNDGGTPLRADEATIASMLKRKGYATGGFGKWGAGGRGSTGVPEKHGFDTFFGYYDQVHAHSFYPPHLVRNSEEVVLAGNNGGRTGETYSHYEIMREGLQFIRDNKDEPFFAYFPITPPHGMYDIPADDPGWAPYKGDHTKDWPTEARNYAAMVTMIDNDLGDILDLLRELGLEHNTLVVFTGDNGGHERFRNKEHPRGFFGPNLNPKTGDVFRGSKGNLYEGGLRIPACARWPGRIQAGTVSDLLWYQIDVFPTLAEICAAEAPDDLDGLSIAPTLFGRASQQKQHAFMYWEYGNMRAVRFGPWKGVQIINKNVFELYNVETDITEQQNVAAAYPKQLAKAKELMKANHEKARPGTFATKERAMHERDRAAKWGTSKGAPASKNVFNGLWDRKGLADANSFKLVHISSENKDNGKHAKNAFDGDSGTWWHSQFNGKLAKHPHELVVDLGDTITVTGFRYLARPNGWNGAIGKCEISILDDPQAEPKLLLAHTFDKSHKIQDVACEPVEGRYLRLKILTAVDDSHWASIAEFGVKGKPVKTEK